ncbi:SusD/RagB family nutrient-binding outer membrane lipoprotein [Tamlana agarivorans]|uniref:SusD/RagB family nutrient-binding outer membrane lipoprotein n=1 Tax=Pseudotamlana agarivorans TaxID=481183 RepID=A0ACC5U4R4_9FLAO|nr:SusD/RagB family nutrient-binding outer membrane lipoprotein [Tamlana agarivorans]MBU2949308.1 SusD/RagB family nutrient-binding outer membrane lipoprotein [Tamlana agarivorans]
MKHYKFIYFSLLVLVFGACTGNFDEIAKNPNNPEEVTPSLLLTTNALAVTAPYYSKTFFNHPLLIRHNVWTSGIENSQYYFFDRSGFGTYSSLRNVIKMEEEARRTGDDVYVGLGHFFRAWYFHSLTLTFGDIPYQEALEGETDALFTPKYDTQEDVFVGILDQLEQANTILANTDNVLGGDVIYDGDISKWRKAVNSFTLRVLISLSKKEGDSKINIAEKFAQIVGDPSTYPIFTSNDDNMQRVFFDIEGERYPFNGLTHNHSQYPHMDSFLMDILKEREDERLFYFAEPTQNAVSSGLQPNDFDAYSGADGTADFNDIVQLEADNELSRIHSRYYEQFDAEPYVSLGYWEQEFNIAEAAQLGWIPNSAEEHYNEGIRANMLFYRNNAVSYDGVTLDDTYIDDYINGPEVAYDPSNGIEQILTQKYIGSYLNTGFNFYYEQRRTGFPDLPVNPNTNLSTGDLNKIPVRWKYPQSELNVNTENVTEAINRQYPVDDVDSLMWLLQ